jgi:Gene product 88
VCVAQVERYLWTEECLTSPEGQALWVSTMIAAIRKTQCSKFRVHDSGDIFDLVYLQLWVRVCQATPGVSYWINTRVWRADAWLDALRALAALPNVTVRPSALKINDLPPVIPGLAAGTTVVSSGETCPARRQGNVCGQCALCTEWPHVEVSYGLH